MKRVAKLLLMLAMVLAGITSDVEGGRLLKEEKVDHPQNFLGGGGGGSGLGGIFPSPGFSFTGVGFGPSGFCTFPSGGCTPILPTIPAVGGGSPPHA
ncbi:hypothetical protein RJT34_23070 [Clitoria ternatea]|uniref:Uncharacterized protein n=1 Tax=Clitoria ternatea TaxID=43366 RepID=A0AAN9IEL2_CLITE